MRRVHSSRYTGSKLLDILLQTDEGKAASAACSRHGARERHTAATATVALAAVARIDNHYAAARAWRGGEPGTFNRFHSPFVRPSSPVSVSFSSTLPAWPVMEGNTKPSPVPCPLPSRRSLPTPLTV